MPTVHSPRVSAKVAPILAAASRLFVERGFEAVSMDAIAAEAGVSKATLYAHFQNKEALFLRILTDHVTEFSRRFDIPERFDPGADDAQEILLRFGRSFAGAFRDDGEGFALMRMFMSEMHRLPGAARVLHENGPVRTRNQLARLLASMTDAGALAISDFEMAADQLTSLLIGHDPMDRAVGLPPPPPAFVEARIRSAVGLFMRGYAAAGRKGRGQ
ncbi:TetR/AcrR family transcriptional regulator [Rhodoplanes sp. Z2-YC6860]|uniref:TetR/AcrR family transcriptional regulator n=1 Tax=Rhodoplanes sp. Z2-YC6860 TaxID=674703 RepID=UPI00078B653A|nr:TetR/AcrR family transcriptional regulator [Rhodoplanes sp. Z2-YC6860]AMN44605.1 TetR family transcriptional regulator [Rhodoplanes sp. Z2-YC6860]